MGIAKVTRNYQVTIPKDVRRVRGIEIGDTVFFALEEGRTNFFKIGQEQLLREAAGMWKGKIKGSSKEYVQKLRQEWSPRLKKMGL